MFGFRHGVYFSMVRQGVFFSFALSLISLMVVLFTPLEITIRESDSIHSPYHEELNVWENRLENGIRPHELKEYESLVEKNNKWFEDERRNYINNSATTPLKAWQKKSSRLAPAIMMVWALVFYFYFRRKPKNHALLVLIFPALLTIAGLMSLLEGILIFFIVSLIWFWWLIRSQRT